MLSSNNNSVRASLIAKLSDVTAKSGFNHESDEAVLEHQQAVGRAGVCEGVEGQIKELFLRGFLKVAG